MRVSVKDLGELLQHVDGGGVLFALQHADIVAIDARTVGKSSCDMRLGVSVFAIVATISRKLMREIAVQLMYCHLVN